VDQNQLKLAVANAAVDFSLTRIDQHRVIGIGTG
jgi:ribose 5-phosphate isomerase